MPIVLNKHNMADIKQIQSFINESLFMQAISTCW